jgi:hypothetical protein
MPVDCQAPPHTEPRRRRVPLESPDQECLACSKSTDHHDASAQVPVCRARVAHPTARPTWLFQSYLAERSISPNEAAGSNVSASLR